MLLSSAHPALLFVATSPRDRLGLFARMNPGDSHDPIDHDPNRLQAGLLAAIVQGDKKALAALYDSLAKPLYSLALRVTNDATEAQDIVQEVFLQVWNKASTYDLSRGSVFGWTATLTRNRAIDLVRKRKRRFELLTESAEELQPEALVSGNDSATSLWLHEKARAVRSALTQLAPEQQKAIELAFFNGLTQPEIAAQLNEPLGTIKARIRRGMLKLRETLLRGL